MVGRALRKLRGITRSDLVLLLQAYPLLWRAEWRLRRSARGTLVVPVPSASETAPRTTPARTASREELGAVERAVLRAGRYGPVRPLCLARALAIQELLRRRGLTAGRVVIGVRLDNGFDAHAWVDYDGVVLGDSPRQVRTFVPFEGARVEVKR